MLNDVTVAAAQSAGAGVVRRRWDPFAGQDGVEAVAVGLWRRRAAKVTSGCMSAAKAEIRGPDPPVRARTEEAK